MTAVPTFGPGKLILIATVAAAGADAGRVRAVRVESSRPVGFSGALLVNRAADEVPALVGRLHALCGHSHATASAMAITAARGDDPAATAVAHFDGLVAERLGEHLRSVFTGPVGLPAGEVSRETLADVRAVLASARGLASAPGGPATTAERRQAAATVRHGVDRLGLRLDAEGRLRPPSGSWAGSVAGRAGGPGREVHLAADPLTPADDFAVIAALAADPSGFAAAPRLAGRRPETGPFTRRGAASAVVDGSARLEARLAEIARAAQLADATADPAEIADWASGAAIDARTGYAAVESPRGRLHHLVRLDEAGRVAFYAVLAPTEWNFGPDGPFVATIRANRLAPGGEGAARIERIAAAFDPCVGFDVRIEEEADA